MTSVVGTNAVTALIGEMTLAEKCAVVAGESMWEVAGCPRLGVPGLTVSDGPVGVRGRLAGPGLVVPGPSALAATWNPGLIREVGAALGQEARDKHVDVVLGPTVNIHRAPRGGRHFECLSEDPELSARIAVAYIEGVQSNGVAACVKHFVCNDQETDRFTIDVRVDERTLREIYLPPFEAAVTEARVRSVMAAYNFVNGEHACAHRELLVDVLRGEWGFDGVVMSDWFAIKDTVGPALGGLDLEMPGPGVWWGSGKLEAAVAAGDVPESAVDAMVANIFGLLAWRGRLTGPHDRRERPVERPEHRALARRAAAESIVLVHNRGDVLPVAAGRRIALIGHGALETAIMGGGSAQLEPYRAASLASAVVERVGADQVTTARGVQLRRHPTTVPEEWLADGVEIDLVPVPPGDPEAAVLDAAPLATFRRPTAANVLHAGSPEWPRGAAPLAVRMRMAVTPPASGRYWVMAAGMHRARLTVDGIEVARAGEDAPGIGLGTRGTSTEIDLEAGHTYEFVLEHVPVGDWPVAIVDVGLEVLDRDAEALLSEAAQAAATADIAVVVVGSTSEWETEGADRPDLTLPAEQDELVRRVAAANPNTVVVLNAGAPVEMPWLDDVAAVLLAWYPGQEGGDAIADVLLGDADPGGRMPTTWARREQDTPAFGNFPGSEGTVTYAEGVFVGYRWYDDRAIAPRVPFGHGGSYTTFEWGAPELSSNGPLTVRVPITNVGTRSGSEVVQVYTSADRPSVRRPPKELAGFAKLHLAPGETRTAEVVLRERALARWDPTVHAWVVDPGDYSIAVAASAADVRATLPYRHHASESER